MSRASRAGGSCLRVAIVLAVAACGPGQGATGAPSGTAPASVATTGVTAPPGLATAGPATRIVACDLLRDDEIQAITGYTVASEVADPADTTYPTACKWRFAGNNWTLVLGVLPTGGSSFFDRTVTFEGATTINGLGDRAARTKVSDAILVVVGDAMIDLQYVAFGEPDDVGQQLAARVVANL